ncbi:MFS transporter [Antribacter sp. KLBMP9083]|uniref:MFS transporter n=1 Tax=Antribacter soli TaxID=2910976 RepID=A0AA41U828_9MICO|nr:MFS transporter [Antribacter soli]MCF4122593.1 MFS transporter [Antribacter soli]
MSLTANARVATAAGATTGAAATAVGPSRAARTAVLSAASLTIMAAAVIAPSLPAMAEVYQDDVLVRLALTITSLAIGLSAPFAGLLTDRLGRRPVLLGGLVLYAAAGTAGLVVTDLSVLLATRAALGLAVGAVTTAVTAQLTDWFSGPARATYLAFQQAAASLGGVALLPLAGVLASTGWRAPFWLYAAAVPVAVLVLVTVRDAAPGGAAPVARPPAPADGVPDSGRTSLLRRRVLGLYALAFAATAVFYMAPTQLPFLLGELGAGPALVGVAIAGTTLTGLLGSLAFPTVRRRLSPAAITLTGVVALGTGWFLVGRADGVTVVVAGLLVGGLGVGLTVPNLNLRLGELAPAARRGQVLAGLVTGVFLGQFASPIAVGPLVAAAGLSGAFTWAGLVTAVGAAVAAPLLLRPRRT